MIATEHLTADGRLILTVCDSELIGTKIEGKGFVLDLSSPFYAGTRKSEDEIVELIGRAWMITLVGKRVVKAGVACGAVSEKSPLSLNGIPYVQAVSMS